MAEHTGSAGSAYFDIPHVSLFLEGNSFIGSENTFNFRISPQDDKLKAYVWYGLNCFELSEPVSEHEEEKSGEGLASLVSFLDGEYEKYNAKVASGEVQPRRTYRSGNGSGSETE